MIILPLLPSPFPIRSVCLLKHSQLVSIAIDLIQQPHSFQKGQQLNVCPQRYFFFHFMQFTSFLHRRNKGDLGLISVRKHSEEWKTSKKVGSLLGSKEDIEHRKHLSNIALNKMEQIWHKADKTKQRTRIKLYNTLVRSVLLYNCGTWALTKTDEEKLDSFHRKQLRRVLGIRYPTKISNKSLYKKCEQIPISLEVLQARWRLFGHVLRREPSIPANKAMAFYFHDNAKRARSRPITTLPMTLNNDLKILQNRSISLTPKKDLETIRKIAERRQEWTTLTVDIKKAAEAARSDDTPSGRP